LSLKSLKTIFLPTSRSNLLNFTDFLFLFTDVTGCKMFPHLSRLAKASLTISHGNAVAERGFSVNTAVLTKDRMSLNEATIQALRVVKEVIRLHGSPTTVPVTRSMINAVRHAHSQYLSHLDSEKQKAAVEVARKKEATQTAADIELARKKTDKLTNQLHEVEQQERKQSEEQDIAQRLINEAASKLSTAVKTGDMQTAKVAQVMLDSGNDKLNESMKQLVDVRACKEKLQGKLMKTQSTLREMAMKRKNTDDEPAGPSAKRPKH